MYLLSLDLGRTTGYATWEDESKIDVCGESVDIDQLYLEFRSHFSGTPEIVVVEKPIVIRGPLGDEMVGLIARTEAEFGEKIHYITPADWKPHPLTRKVRENVKGLKLSKHAVDALCMGTVFIHKNNHLKSA